MKRPHRCKPSCLHCRSVQDYRIARANDEEMCERTCIGWGTEHRDYPEHGPLITFKTWLRGMRQVAT